MCISWHSSSAKSPKHHPKKHTCKAYVCTDKNQQRPAFSMQGHSKGRANRAVNESKYVPIPCQYCCSKEKLQVCSCDKSKESEEQGKGGPRVPNCCHVAILSGLHSPLALQHLYMMVFPVSKYTGKLQTGI